MSVYPLHASVLEVMSANIGAEYDDITVATRSSIENSWYNWRSMSGTPRYLFEDGEGNAVMVPAPVAIGTVRLTVKRLPLTPMSAGNSSPEIAEKHHYRMVDWALRCAYLKQDADAEDKTKATEFENAFGLSFGYRPDANVKRKQRYPTGRVVRSSW